MSTAAAMAVNVTCCSSGWRPTGAALPSTFHCVGGAKPDTDPRLCRGDVDAPPPPGSWPGAPAALGRATHVTVQNLTLRTPQVDSVYWASSGCRLPTRKSGWSGPTGDVME